MEKNLKKMLSVVLAFALAAQPLTVNAADYITDTSVFEAEPLDVIIEETPEVENAFTDGEKGLESTENTEPQSELDDFLVEETEEVSFDDGIEEVPNAGESTTIIDRGTCRDDLTATIHSDQIMPALGNIDDSNFDAGMDSNSILKSNITANSYSLLVSGVEFENGDRDGIKKILLSNTSFKNNSTYTLTYNTDSTGITKANYEKAIDAAYRDCTSNDTAFFFHGGHGMEGFKEGMGIVLKEVMDVPVWYTYDSLLKKLCNVNCKHMIIIINACESGAVKKAYDKLPAYEQDKISLFWSSAANQLSHKHLGSPYSVYGHTLIQLLTQENGYINSDVNHDGNVTVRELGNYINEYIGEVSEYYGTPKQTPGFASPENMNTIIYSKNILWLDKTTVTIYTSGTTSIKLNATVVGPSQKITWKSSNESIATVDSDGTVKARKVGTAMISASVSNIQVPAVCKVTVVETSTEFNRVVPVLKSVSNGSTTLNVKWNKVKDATGYQVYRQENSGSWKRVATIKSGNTVSYTDSKVVNGRRYGYRVYATKGSERSKASKAIYRYFIARNSISSLAKGKSYITVKWKSNSTATGYQIQYANKSNFSGAKTVKVANRKTTSKNLKPGFSGNCYVRVRTYKTVGSVTYYSAWSATKRITLNAKYELSEYFDKSAQYLVDTFDGKYCSFGADAFAVFLEDDLIMMWSRKPDGPWYAEIAGYGMEKYNYSLYGVGIDTSLDECKKLFGQKGYKKVSKLASSGNIDYYSFDNGYKKINVGIYDGNKVANICGPVTK